MKNCAFCDFHTTDAAAFGEHMRVAHGWGAAHPDSSAARSRSTGRDLRSRAGDTKAALVISIALEAVSYQLTLANGFRAQGAFDVVFNLFVFFWIGQGAVAIYHRFDRRI